MRSARRCGHLVPLLVLGALAAGCSGLDAPPRPTPVASPRTSGGVTPSDLAIGECFAVPTGDGTSVNLVTLEACADPHELEVVGRLIDPAAPEASYRGSDAIRSLASAACSSSFEDYVGIAPMGSNLDAWMFAPSETSWVSGDRTVICAAGEPGRASLTGSVFDTRR